MKKTKEEKEINKIRKMIEKGTRMILVGGFKKAEAEKLVIEGAKIIFKARQECGHKEIKYLCDLCKNRRGKCEICNNRNVSLCVICGERVQI